jgi:hypothetical protein
MIPGDDSEERFLRGRASEDTAATPCRFWDGRCEIIAPQREPIAARRIHVSGAAIQSTFTSLTLDSTCVAVKRLVMRNAPRVLT